MLILVISFKLNINLFTFATNKIVSNVITVDIYGISFLNTFCLINWMSFYIDLHL